MNEIKEFIVDITEENIQTELLEKSKIVPVLLDVWADWCEPCKALSPVLHRLAEAYEGRFILAKVNADEQQNIVSQLQVRSLPTLKLIVQGEIVAELVGVQSESAIKAMLDQHVAEPDTSAGDADAILEQVEILCKAGAFEQAAALLKAFIEEHPDNEVLKVRYARLLLNLNAFDDAHTIVNSLSEATRTGELGKQFNAQLYFAELVKRSPGMDLISERLNSDASDAEARCYLAACQVMNYETDSALESCWQLFSQHRNFTLTENEAEGDSDANQSTGKQCLLALFDLLGKQDARVGEYRRKMFTLLH